MESGNRYGCFHSNCTVSRGWIEEDKKARWGSEKIGVSGITRIHFGSGRERFTSWRKSSIPSIRIWISVIFKAISQIFRGAERDTKRYNSYNGGHRGDEGGSRHRSNHWEAPRAQEDRVRFSRGLRRERIPLGRTREEAREEAREEGEVRSQGHRVSQKEDMVLNSSLPSLAFQAQLALTQADPKEEGSIEELENEFQNLTDEELEADRKEKENGVDVLEEEKQGDEAVEKDQNAEIW
ncbi:hypothetical protein F2Q68_00021178 [Brassica cretica]|uniref:Uncharacterized protein n=1 Tax=Brassica cretica TaxID=69181 RepID=A0A8S9FXI5_BRACR|nr:hypothetical protein F2Q68_00021178 [Brassica cretica]